jgi:hypothetical protein
MSYGIESKEITSFEPMEYMNKLKEGELCICSVDRTCGFFPIIYRIKSG